jgi:hypothetical protein
MTKKRADEEQDGEEQDLPPFRIHETDNYMTAIIGGRQDNAGEETKSGFTGFYDMLTADTRDPLLHEQMLDVLKESPNAVEFLLEALESARYAKFKKDLLAMCWEAGIDMSKHLAYFIKMTCESNDPLLLIELQTIIQEMDLSDAVSVKKAVAELKQSLEAKTDPIGKEIVNDLIYFLESRE